MLKDQDALYVEQWLIGQSGDIIGLFAKFQSEHQWKPNRANQAFFLVWLKSEKVGW